MAKRRKRTASSRTPSAGPSTSPESKVDEATESRFDAWINYMSGSGTSRDKLTWAEFVGDFERDAEELRGLYYGDDVAYRIVASVVKDATRPGYELEGKDADKWEAEIKRLKLDAKIAQARQWGRLYGGGAVILGVDDGRKMDEPVDDVSRVRGIKFANVVVRARCVAIEWYDDPLSDEYGKPSVFMVTRVGAGRGDPGTRVHADRMLRFFGTEVDEEEQRRCQGWSHSVLFRVYQVMRDFAQAFGSAGQLMIDAGQAVFKMKGVADAATLKAKGPGMRKRMQEVDLKRSSGRAIVLDKDQEDFERKPTPLAGVSDILDHFEKRLAAAAEMPVSKLMGQAPAGMDATGEGDRDLWAAQCTTERNDHLTPAYDRAIELLSAGAWEGCVEWCALEEPSAKEQSETDLNRAKKYDTEIKNGVLKAAEVTLMEYGGRSADDVIDEDALEAELQAEKDLADAAREAAAKLTPEDHAAMRSGMGSPPSPPSPATANGGTAPSDAGGGKPPAAIDGD